MQSESKKTLQQYHAQWKGRLKSLISTRSVDLRKPPLRFWDWGEKAFKVFAQNGGTIIIPKTNIAFILMDGAKYR
jgi:hypothetical protein